MPSTLTVVTGPETQVYSHDSLTGKNNVILDYYGVWQTYMVSFAHD